MRTQIISDQKEFYALKKEWNALLEEINYKHLFLTNEWLAAWWEVYGINNELFIILVRGDNGSIKAIAPLMIKRGIVNKLQFIAHDVSDYMDLIVNDEAEECFSLIFSVISSNRHRWDWAELIYIAKDSPNFVEWGRRVEKLDGMVEKSISFDGVAVYADLLIKGGSWDEFEKKLPPKRRNDLKRCSKLLAQQGKLIFELLNNESDIKSNLIKFVDYHKKRWGGKGRLSQFYDPRKIEHYLKLNEKMAGKGWLELSILRLDENFMAFAFGYVYNNRYYYYTPSFNPEYYRFSPGNLLIKHLIVDSYRRGIKYFDLLRGDESYKYIWGSDEVKLYRIRFYRSSIKGTVLIVLHRAFDYVRGYLSRCQDLKKIRDRIKGLMIRNVS